MKRNRIILGILWILSLVGISFFGGPVSYGFFALLTLVPLVSLGYLLCTLTFFRIYQELDSKNLVADHQVDFFFTLMNEYFFGFSSIRVRFFSSFSKISGLDDGVEYELLPGTGITKQTVLLCRYRGEYEVGIKSVEMQDYLRLFRITHHNKETLRVIVRPNLVTLEELRSAENMDTMARESQANQTEPDALVRRYESGDDLRHVHWKASARCGELLTRKYVGEEREGVAIVLATWRCGEEQMQYLPAENKMLETALALALFYAKKKIAVRVWHLADGLRQSSVSGLEEFERYYEMLSTVEFREKELEESFWEELSVQQSLFAAKTVYVVIQEWTSAVNGMIQLLSENHVQTIIYLICDELPESASGFHAPRASLIQIATDADLREVM